nr:glycerol-3-phosphate acyltransferase, chloroplastic-like isoform X1 [Coffea arabica]
MVILSAPPPCSLFTSGAAAAAGAARASSPACSSWRAASIFSVKVSSSVEFCPSAKSVRGMAEIFGGDKTKGSATAAAEALAASGSSSSCSVSELSLSLNFVDFRTEEDLLSGIRKAAESGRLPLNVTQGMEELYQNYRNAVYQSGDPKAREIVLSNMALAFDRIFMDVKDPFEFSSYHKAIREPFDYYMFGQNYIRPLIDFRNSYVGNISLFNEIGDKLLQGDNIVLMSNHQTEADPAVIALLLESTNPNLAENMIYVAGDRVITDPLCKPFSMGRNLLCVYSKKHMNDDPELVEMKRRANTKSLKEMALLLRGGSTIIWIAPSGGRDRPDPVSGEWYPAPFDVSSVDNMRRLVEHAGIPGHIYPLAILCHDIMPPPPKVEKEIGEKRMISFHGVGLSVAPEIGFHAASLEDPEKTKTAYTQALYDSVNEQYNVLKSAIHGKQGLNASTPTVSLSQPWQ